MGDATSEAACSFLGPVYLGRSYCLAIGVGEHDCTRFGLRRQELGPIESGVARSSTLIAN